MESFSTSLAAILPQLILSVLSELLVPELDSYKDHTHTQTLERAVDKSLQKHFDTLYELQSTGFAKRIFCIHLS